MDGEDWDWMGSSGSGIVDGWRTVGLDEK